MRFAKWDSLSTFISTIQQNLFYFDYLPLFPLYGCVLYMYTIDVVACEYIINTKFKFDFVSVNWDQSVLFQNQQTNVGNELIEVSIEQAQCAIVVLLVKWKEITVRYTSIWEVNLNSRCIPVWGYAYYIILTVL